VTGAPPATPLANPAANALFTIPPEDWSVLAGRLAAVESLLPIEADVAQTLPGFPALVEACDMFESQTAPQLKASSIAVEGYCAQEVTAFQNVIDLLQAQGGSVSLSVSADLTGALHDLATSTRDLANQLTGLGPAIRAFADANAAVDEEVQGAAAGLGGLGVAVATQAAAATTAAEFVEGVWTALADDLDALTVPTLVPSTFLDGLALDVAIDTWHRLQQEAAAFASSFPIPTEGP
jgi:hypothetical protein